MAAAAWPEEEFVCSVCLETLRDPATLPCGHTYCLSCIQGHWDRNEAKGQCNCPQCRQVFTPRPSLAKSTVLVEAMEKLRRKGIQEHPYLSISSAPPSMPVYLEVCADTGLRQGGMYPQLPVVSHRLCPQHQRPLELYCHDDKECVCDECCRHGHKGHRVVKPDEERKERQCPYVQRELVPMQAETQRRIQEMEKELKEFPQAAQLHKSSVQVLQKEGVELFSELVKSVELMGTQVRELLCTHEDSMGSRSEGHIHKLEQELAQLRRKDQELSRLASMQDHICFLKNFFTLEPLTQNGGREGVGLGEEALVSEIQTVMGELRDGLQDLCKSSMAKIFRTVNDATLSPSQLFSGQVAGNGASTDNNQVATQNTASEVPSNPRLNTVNQVTTVGLANPEPKTREQMLKFCLNPTFDPNTAYRHLKLGDGDRKATLKAEKQDQPEHPDRFIYWRQILCREPLAGSPYYWETEWTGQKITIGVAYRDLSRKEADDSSRLGYNEQSWSLNWSGTGFSMWHAGKETQLSSTKARRLGVYLDQHEGVLAFYRISNNQAHLIHSLQTDFTGPLYPGFRFWSGVGVSVTLCQLD
ncbi:finTRIM family, member 86 isoform X1 [Salmo salar]|uniref:FinTRIM family, member 86 isoform X1 n=1 Tax=Salmo salar TaxID=8030 RepID=A0A1S3NRD1_SALSA|nr:finTRIM family, member 86 isoform X1 [Salmo salar]|eukprot:XP_014017761.1 PREDICTED: tripartite motif-containing protein 16-like protein isoform X3 [Salmo salar]